MANKEHLKIIIQGVDTWNEWRSKNPEIEPDLSGSNLGEMVYVSSEKVVNLLLYLGIDKEIIYGLNLNGADLRKVNFNSAKLRRASLKGADLSEANLTKTDITKADLTEANLTKANLNESNLNKVVMLRADLTEANITKADMTGADLRETKLSKAILKDAILRGVITSKKDKGDTSLEKGAELTDTNFNNSDLTGADLRYSDLSRVNLSGAIINENTKYDKNPKGCQVGVNGIWCESTDSAALMTLTPPGNSMQGSDSEAVIVSLKRVRGLHSYSLTLAGIGFLIAVLGLPEIKLPFLSDIEVSSIRYALLAMPISFGILSLVKMFMESALNGASYLQDRNSAMKVGNFPWALSKYSGKSKGKKIQSLITRFVMCFHPFIYLYFGIQWNSLVKGDKSLSVNDTFALILYIGFGILLLFFSAWIFILSQRFQKPILFDRKSEKISNKSSKFTMDLEHQKH